MQKNNKIEINKIAFWISISLNLSILVLGTFWIASKGGIPYVVRTISYLLNPESIDNNSFYGADRKSLLKLSQNQNQVLYLWEIASLISVSGKNYLEMFL
jgi:hypothetical protein